MSGSLLGIRDAGPRALLVEFSSLADVLAHHQHFRATPLPGQREAVAAARTVLLRFDSPSSAHQARQGLSELTVDTFSAGDSQVVELDVVYDGEDLAEVAELVGLSVEALISWHTGGDWTGAFGGFAPGFTYCVPVEGERVLNVPRRETPRTAVPVGSVALAGEFSAVYPRVSPGGWQLIGRTPAQMWDLDRGSPALVRPGDVVRYRSVRGAAVVSGLAGGGNRSETQGEGPGGAEVEDQSEAAAVPESHAAFEVLDPGLQTLIQDLGREGLSELGVSRAGAADESALRQGNRLVGNVPGAPVLETLLGGLSLRALATVVLAVTGTEAPVQITDPDGGRRTAPSRAPVVLTSGETLSLGSPTRGLRAVLAFRGGIDVEPVLGSASADTMSGLGPAPLQAGDRVALGEEAVAPVGSPEPSTLPAPDDDGALTLRFTLGPRDDWFTAEEVARLQSQRWQVSQESNRIGLRLELADGPLGGSDDSSGGPSGDLDAPGADSPRPLIRAREDELPSEGVPRGSLQMPPAGLPVLFLNDHPVTGGYPVIGVVVEEDLSAAAQLAPGSVVRLRAVDPVRLRAVDPVRLRAVDPHESATDPSPKNPAPKTPSQKDPV